MGDVVVLFPESIHIKLTQCPWPESADPAFVKEAMRDLFLTARWFIEPDEVPLVYPRGAYAVDVAEVLRAMAAHEYRTYQYLCALWGDSNTAVVGYNGIGMQLLFSSEYCTRVVS